MSEHLRPELNLLRSRAHILALLHPGYRDLDERIPWRRDWLDTVNRRDVRSFGAQEYHSAVYNPDLGEFLRACRAKLDPIELGLPQFGTRRVAGLRREEVATLAGISADYYTRLEQGRERNPSGQVVDAIARALRLDPDSHEHLLRLAGVLTSANSAEGAEAISEPLLELLASLHNVAAYVMNRILDVLALNDVAAELFSPLAAVDNMARMVFMDRASRTYLGNWQVAAESVVHSLRIAEGFSPRNPELQALLTELRETSSDFDSLWAANTAKKFTQLINTMHDVEFGPIDYTALAFEVRGTEGQQLVIMFAKPESRSARSLEELNTRHILKHFS
jgi:transcriptional regulator with XRE-family HTH domain